MSDFTGPGVYQLHCEHDPDKVLHLPGVSTANGTQVTSWSQNAKAEHLKWMVADAGNNEYLVLNYKTGGCLTAEAGGQNGGKVTVNLIGAHDKRALWKIVPARTGTGSYYLENVGCPGLIPVVNMASTKNNTPIVQWAKGDYKHGRWFIKLADF